VAHPGGSHLLTAVENLSKGFMIMNRGLGRELLMLIREQGRAKNGQMFDSTRELIFLLGSLFVIRFSIFFFFPLDFLLFLSPQ
jgi:hypothetical protein